jgi:hypothetical protein
LNDNLDDVLPPNYTADAIHKHRNTEIPQTTNSHGKSSIELCIEAQLRILNGRTLGDSKGQLTFFNHNGSSVVDYCICSSDILPSVVNFTIGDFEPNLSDHRPISINLLSHYIKNQNDELRILLKILQCSRAREDNFVNNMKNFDFKNILSELDEIDKLSATKNDSHIILEKSIDDIVKEVSSVLYNAACLGDRDKRISKNKKAKRKIKKPYYDKECENKYRILKAKSRQLCNEPWNKTLCLKVLQNKKELNKLVRKKYRQFRHTMSNKLVDSNANKPGEFWKALNAIKQR